MAYQDHRELVVWKKAMTLVREVYNIIKTFPRDEKYCMCDQMRRSLISIPSNIAEGHGRNSAKEFIHFLNIANGSRAEVETQLELAYMLNYIDEEVWTNLFSQTQELQRMMYALQSNLKKQL